VSLGDMGPASKIKTVARSAIPHTKPQRTSSPGTHPRDKAISRVGLEWGFCIYGRFPQ